MQDDYCIIYVSFIIDKTSNVVNITKPNLKLKNPEVDLYRAGFKLYTQRDYH